LNDVVGSNWCYQLFMIMKSHFLSLYTNTMDKRDLCVGLQKGLHKRSEI